MNPTIQLKAAQVREKRAELSALFPSGDCVLVSVQSHVHNTRGGQYVEVPVDVAAQHIVEGSHRLATADEIKKFRVHQSDARKAISASESAKGVAYFLGKESR